MKKIKELLKNKLFYLISCGLLNIQFAGYEDSGTTLLTTANSKLLNYGALGSYVTAVSGNINSFVTIGFMMACVMAGIGMLLNNENVIKALSKIMFGLFILKVSAAAMALIVK